MHSHGAEFADISMADRDAIEMYCIQHAVPIWQLQYRTAVSLIDRTKEFFQSSRSEDRQVVHLPVEISYPEGSSLIAENESSNHIGVLDELSLRGARMLLDRPVSPGTTMKFVIPRSDMGGIGEAIYSTTMKTSSGVRFLVGLRRLEGEPGNPNPWPAYGRGAGPVPATVAPAQKLTA